MSVVLKSLGGFFLLVGIIWAVYIVVAVATHTEGYSTIRELIPGLAFHAISLFLGMVLMGLGQKFKKSGLASRSNVVGLAK